MSDWLPIVYRDFYDLPRAIVVRYQGRMFLLDAPFDEVTDAYPESYDVYVLVDVTQDDLAGSWEVLHQRGTHIGVVAADRLVLDSSRRRAIDSAVLEEFHLALRWSWDRLRQPGRTWLVIPDSH